MVKYVHMVTLWFPDEVWQDEECWVHGCTQQQAAITHYSLS